MKQVFIETNFLIALARPLQEDRAARLAQRNGHDVILYVPWCSVTEARRKLADIIDDDLGFDQAIMKFAVRELLPSGDHATLATLDAFAKRAREARRVAKAGADATIDALVHTALRLSPAPPPRATARPRGAPAPPAPA